MSALGHKRDIPSGSSCVRFTQKRTYALQQAMSALHPIATAKAKFRKSPCPLYPNSGHVVRSFNYFVGQQQERLADGKAERLGLFEIDDQFKFGRGLKWQIARRFALENAINIAGKLEQNDDGLKIRLSDAISLSVPESQAPRYRSVLGKEVLFGLRPEHVTEPRHNDREGREFTVTLDVVEPMGMETMVYFSINGTEVCGRVEPSSAKASGEPMLLYANVDHMHLIDPRTNLVL